MRQKISDEKRGSPSLILLSIIFSIPASLWDTEGFLYEMIRYCETKQFWRKIVIPASFLIPNIFRYQKFSETQKGSSTKTFGTVRLKTFDGKSWCPPIMHKVFRYLKFFETLKGSSTKFFGTGRLKTFDGKSWCPPTMHKVFRYLKFFETLEPKCSQRNFSVLRQKNLNEVLCIKYRNQWWNWCL